MSGLMTKDKAQEKYDALGRMAQFSRDSALTSRYSDYSGGSGNSASRIKSMEQQRSRLASVYKLGSSSQSASSTSTADETQEAELTGEIGSENAPSKRKKLSASDSLLG